MAVKIDNYPAGRPQSGLDKADIVFEEPVEGGITRYAAVFQCQNAGLIGPAATPRNYPGSLSGTPVFIGCSDSDVHIPLARVHETTDVLRRLGGDLTERIYPGMGHAINDDEVKQIRRVLAGLLQANAA